MQTYQNGQSRLSVDGIKMDKDLMFREKLNEEAIERYADRYKTNLYMPPITVYYIPERKGYFVVDGFHRLSAAKKAELKEIEVDLKTGSFEEAKWKAANANLDHGQPLNLKERKKVCVEFLKKYPERSDNWIAGDVGLNSETVRKIRERLENNSEIRRCDRFQTRDGRWYPRTIQSSSQQEQETVTRNLEETEASNLDENNPNEVAQRGKNILDHVEKHGEVIRDDFAEDNKKSQDGEPKKKKERLHKIEDPPAKRQPRAGYVLEPSKEQEEEELHQDKIMDLVNEGCESVDPSKIKDIGESEERYELAKVFAQFINLTFDEMEWEDDVYEDFFELEDGRVFHVIIEEKQASSNSKDVEQENGLDSTGEEETTAA